MTTIGDMGRGFVELMKPIAELQDTVEKLGKAFEAVGKLFDAQRAFDKLNVQLVAVTGSVSNASQAFEQLQKFAIATPFNIEETTKAFLKLKNTGLDSSEKAMHAYGNTATALGKGLDDVVDAIAGATGGSFDDLEKLGIQAEKKGNQVSLSFQGVSTTIGNNAGEIQGYLQKLGETKFAGAMQASMATLDGSIGTLKDAWDAFSLKLSESGLGEIAKQAIGTLTDVLLVLGDNAGAVASAMILAGEVGGAYFAVFIAAPAIVTAVTTAIAAIRTEIGLVQAGMAIGASTTDLLTQSFGGASVSAELAAGSLDKLKLAGGLLFAAFAGWEIGSWLYDNFTEARVAGLAFVGVMLTGWEDIKYGGQMAWAALGYTWETVVGTMKEALADFLSVAAKGFALVGASDTAKGIDTYADQLRSAAKVQGSFSERTAGITAAHKAALTEIEKNVVELIQYEQTVKKVAATTEAIQNKQRATTVPKASLPNTSTTNAAMPGTLIGSQANFSSDNTLDLLSQQMSAQMPAQNASIDAEIASAFDKQVAADIQGSAGKSDAAVGKAKTELDSLKKTWDSVEQTAHKAFNSIFEKGKSAFSGLRDTLKSGLMNLLYEMTVKKWVVSIGASMGLGGASGLAQAAGLEGGTAAGAGSGVMGLVQNASTIYKAVTGKLGELSDTFAGGIQDVMNEFGFYPHAIEGLATSSGQAVTALASKLGWAGATVTSYMGGAALNSAISGQYKTGSGVETAEKIATAIASAFPGAGFVAGAVSGVINRAFGMGDKKVTSQGIRGTLTADSLTGTNYATWHQDGGWFRSDKNGTDTTALDDATVKQFTEGLQAIEKVSTGFAKSLGLSSDWLGNYSKTFDIATTGDSSKDQQAVTDFFAGISNEIANRLVPNLSDFTKSGETASATLERLAGDFQGTDQVAQLLGASASSMFGASGLDSAKARERLIDLAGGMSTLSQEATTFNQNFLTEAERIKAVATGLDAALNSLGLQSIPTTRDEFKALVNNLVESGAAATDSGAKQLASLLALADAFSEVHPETATKALQERQNLQGQLDQLTLTSTQLHEKERASIDASNLALYDRVSALQAEKAAASVLLGDVDSAFSVLQKVVEREKAAVQTTIDAHTAAVSKLQSLSDALHSAFDSLKTPAQQLAGRVAAQAEIRADLAISKAGGSLSDDQAESLKKALSAVNQDASSQFDSYNDYLRDLYETQSDIAQLGSITDDSLLVEQAALKAAQDQLESLDAVLKNAQEQIDVLKGQSTTLLSIDDAIAGLATAIGSAKANPVVSATSAIATQYQQSLGRPPDAAGMAYWQQQAAAGVSTADITQAIATSAEATIQGMYRTMIGHAADAAGLQFWLQQAANGTSLADIGNAIAGSPEAQAKVRGYASGGDHAGGWRIVGEYGPELEATGPARIFSASETSSLMSRLASPSGNTDALVAEIRALRAEVKSFREANTAENGAIAKHALNTADHLDAVINGDTPLSTKVIP